MFLEREAIMKGLLTSQDGEDHHLETHHALLAIFTDFTKRLFEKHENIITSMKQDVLVEVTWLKSSTVGEKSIDIDIAILQSSLLLFAYNHTHSDEYKYLASIWTATESYSVFDKTTKEKIDIVNNKSLRKLLVVSNLDALVEEGLRNAPSEDLLSLLHTFGLPLNSRKNLLQRLDEVATERPTEILKDITDKQKCLLFAELAMEDGDISGLKFCKLLQPDYLRANENEEKMDTDEIIDATFVCGDFTDDDDDDKKTSEAVSPQIAKLESNLFDDHKEIESALRMYFTSNDKKQVSNYITLKQKVSLQIIKCKDEDNELSNKLLYVLESLLNENEFRDYFMKSSGEACVLINILVKSFPNDSTDRLHDVFLILQHKLNSSHPLSKIFSGIRLTTELRNEHAQTVNDLLNDISKHTKSSKKSKERGRNKKDKQNTNDILDELIAKLKVEDNLEGISKKRLANGLVSISREKPQILEEIITILFEKVKDSRNCRVLLDTLFDMLKKVDPSCLGLLLDWIALIDTEIVHLNPTQQRELLFCKSDSVNVTYFLTLLAQQTRAYTLDDCLTWLLDSPRPVERMDANNRLKLISCMWLNANLWQGRDKNHSSQNDNSGDLHVSLTIPQIVIFIELILTKMMRNEQQGDQGTENSEEVSEYISLLLLLTQSMSNLLKKAVHIIVQSKRFPDSIVKIFLEHFYLQQPMLVDHKIDEMFELNPPMKSKATIDDTIHRLIMSVSEPNGTQEWKNKFDAVDSISRRMAVQYPRIYKRQLPLLLSTMRGITRMTANRFEKTNQLLFCDHVIDVFDILKAYLFKQDEESVNIMRAYVDAFLQLIMSSCLSMHACVSTLGKFVDFLNHYIASGNADSEKVLYSHEPVFRGLMIDYPNFEGLTSICTFISSSKCKPTLVASHANTWNDVQIDAFKQRLHQDHYIEDLVNVLEDLDESSKRQVDVLSNFVEDLTPLMGSSNDALREKSYVLLFRYAKFNTRVSERLLAKMIECLSDERQQIVRTASRYAPKILTISSGRSDELLECMYKLATSSHRNITNDVIESIGNINIDYI